MLVHASTDGDQIQESCNKMTKKIKNDKSVTSKAQCNLTNKLQYHHCLLHVQTQMYGNREGTRGIRNVLLVCTCLVHRPIGLGISQPR